MRVNVVVWLQLNMFSSSGRGGGGESLKPCLHIDVELILRLTLDSSAVNVQIDSTLMKLQPAAR